LDVTGFAALIKRKRGEARLTQETLALDVFGDAARKADISRLENARVPNPQEATIQKLCKALNISTAEMEPLRQSRPSAAQLDNIPSLSREALQNLAARFNIDDCFELPDEDLRKQLTLRADEFRALKAEVDSIPDTMRNLANLKAAAQDAIDRVDLAEVENLMAIVHETELEEAAKSAEIRANTALLRGKVEDAFRYLSAAADSFAAVDPTSPARKRLGYDEILYAHGQRYGSTGMTYASDMIRDAIALLDRDTHSTLWAGAQNNLANALAGQGTRTHMAQGADLLAKAVAAFRNALEVFTRAEHPMDWAMTQNNFGNALQEQGIRTQGDEGADLLAEAVTAFRNALKVRTRVDYPVDWAMTQNNLAIALQRQSTRTQGDEGADLLAKAVTAFRNALKVRTRVDYPVQWAMAQNNLGIALQEQSTRTEGAKGAALLAEAVTAYRSALEVRTRANHPVHWATTQNNLAIALQNQGIRTQGAEGADLLTQALTVYSAALEVRTRADHPVHWAMTQENIALCQLARANHDSCPDPRPPLTAALEAVDNALNVFDPVHMSYNHAKATRLRADIQAKLNALPPE
jgi:tetratricopeptide (TPR) repeat protein